MYFSFLIRNYIHLCINLSVAQILLVAGIDKTGDPHRGVPIHCQLIAVLLHYLSSSCGCYWRVWSLFRIFLWTLG